MKRYTVDGRGVRSFDDFITAMNLGLVQPAGGLWHGNLDALNDYLSWPDDAEYELELLGAGNCIATLGHEAQAEWLRTHILTCHSANVADMQSRLKRAEAREGETLFDIIREIIAANPHVHLVLR
jgi:hypothetical protein